MRYSDLLFERTFADARSFGIWLGYSLYHEIYGYKDNDDEEVLNYDYLDDEKGRPLRYRFICNNHFRGYIHNVMLKIKAVGWHLTLETKRGRNKWQLVFEPVISGQTKQAVFWHVTPRANVQSILKNGLIPKESRHGISYPQKRIYLLRKESDAGQMVQVFGQRDKTPIEYVTLKVDLRKSGIKVYIDPELKNVAVYTIATIPAERISITTTTF